MRIERLEFNNYRNLNSINCVPSAGINIIWGENGQGKTNLLEGIYLFAHLKSFRGAANADLIGPLAGRARVAATIQRSGVERHLELLVEAQGRKFLVDDKPPRPVESLLEVLRAILFAPDEMHPLRIHPAARRNLVDRSIFQLDPAFLGVALDYERILKQRNRLLREQAGPALLQPWDEQFIAAGARIRLARSLFLKSLHPLLVETHHLLGGDGEELAIVYPAAAETLALHMERLTAEREQVRSRESRMGTSCCGPHRDDPFFLLNREPVRHFASQGEWRTVVLSYKIALLRLLQERIGVPPLLLLDDMAAELDQRRQERLFALLAGAGAQIFVTTTDPQPFKKFGFATIEIFAMRAGEIFIN